MISNLNPALNLKAGKEWTFLELENLMICKPFLHHPGDEWMAANPIEILGSPKIVETCLSFSTSGTVSQQSESFLFTLLVELLDQAINYLDGPGLYAIAGTCRTLRYHVQPFFRRRVLKEKEDFSWLWEFLDGTP